MLIFCYLVFKSEIELEMYTHCLQTEESDFRLDSSTTTSYSLCRIYDNRSTSENSHGRPFIVSNTFVAQESYQ